jgi:hypothetical protein
MAGQCNLYDRDCTNCGECDCCDLDETRVCDNCGKCIENTGDFRSLHLDEFRESLKDRKKLPKKQEKDKK